MENTIAVASSDGTRIDAHFGRTRRFRVYRFEGGKWLFQEDRESRPPCGSGEHVGDLLEQAVELVADCRWVVASQIGPGAIDALIDRGVFPLFVRGMVDEALTIVGRQYLGLGDTGISNNKRGELPH